MGGEPRERERAAPRWRRAAGSRAASSSTTALLLLADPGGPSVASRPTACSRRTRGSPPTGRGDRGAPAASSASSSSELGVRARTREGRLVARQALCRISPTGCSRRRTGGSRSRSSDAQGLDAPRPDSGRARTPLPGGLVLRLAQGRPGARPACARAPGGRSPSILFPRAPGIRPLSNRPSGSGDWQLLLTAAGWSACSRSGHSRAQPRCSWWRSSSRAGARSSTRLSSPRPAALPPEGSAARRARGGRCRAPRPRIARPAGERARGRLARARPALDLHDAARAAARDRASQPGARRARRRPRCECRAALERAERRVVAPRRSAGEPAAGPAGRPSWATAWAETRSAAAPGTRLPAARTARAPPARRRRDRLGEDRDRASAARLGRAGERLADRLPRRQGRPETGLRCSALLEAAGRRVWCFPEAATTAGAGTAPRSRPGCSSSSTSPERRRRLLPRPRRQRGQARLRERRRPAAQLDRAPAPAHA